MHKSLVNMRPMITKTNVLALDLGSSTLKASLLTPNGVEVLTQKSVSFKNDFDPESGLGETSQRELFEFVNSIKSKYPDSKIKVFATALYRKLTDKAKIHLVDIFFQQTGLYFNIIEHDLENFYLEVALVSKSNLDQPVLLINIGGGSTELVVMKGKDVLERHNVELGVGTINSQFSDLNNKLPVTTLDQVIDFVSKNLPNLENITKIAFYTGGELDFMRLANYRLLKNNLFEDKDHPLLINTDVFEVETQKIYTKITLQKLEQLMPNNPTWMHGARACSALALAICKKYDIKMVIPSNSNLIDGVSRQEFRHVTISGSFRKHLDYILKIKSDLEKNCVKVLSPRFIAPQNPGEEFVVFNGEEGQSPLNLERHHLDSISKSDALIVCNPDGYVDASSLIEIGYASSIGKRIIFTEEPEEFMLKTLPHEVGL